MSEVGEAGQFRFAVQTDCGQYQHMHETGVLSVM